MNGVELHAPGIVHLCYGIDDASTVLVSCGNGDSLLKISDVDTLEERNRYKNKTPFVSCAHAPQQPLIVTGDTSNLVKVRNKRNLLERMFRVFGEAISITKTRLRG